MSNALTPAKFLIGLTFGMLMTFSTVDFLQIEKLEDQALCALFYAIITSYWAAKNTVKIPD